MMSPSLMLALLVAALSLVSAKEKGPIDVIEKEERLNAEDILAIKKEFKALYNQSVIDAHADVDRKDRKHHDHEYNHKSDAESWAGVDGDKHARRLPVFEAARKYGAGKPLALLQAAIKKGIAGCKSAKADLPYCVKAVNCTAVHAITQHWAKLHLVDSECQGIINQLRGGRNKKNFDPKDKDDLKDVEDDATAALEELATARLKYRVICDKDFKCNQKVDCYLTSAIANAYPTISKLVRCPYGEFERSEISSSSSESDEESEESESDK